MPVILCVTNGYKVAIMDKQTHDYRMAETLAAAPIPVQDCGQIKIQIRTDKGATKWLGITPDEFRAIEFILLGGASCN